MSRGDGAPCPRSSSASTWRGRALARPPLVAVRVRTVLLVPPPRAGEAGAEIDLPRQDARKGARDPGVEIALALRLLALEREGDNGIACAGAVGVRSVRHRRRSSSWF